MHSHEPMPFCPVDADVALTPDDVAGSAPRPSLADAKLLSPPPRAADGALLAPVEPPNWEALAEALLPPPRRGALLRDGFAVVDGALGDGYASALRSELLGLVAAGGLRPNRTAFAGAAGAALVYSKPGVVEADLHDPALAQSLLCGGGLPALAAWFAASAGEFVDALSARLPALRLERGPRARAVKLASSSRGSAFPLHYDNPGPPCRRALTLLLYLNPDWAPGDGGELVLQPFLGAAQSVPPLHGRFVLFLADRLLHRTLPSACPRRLCVTTWFDGGATNSAAGNEKWGKMGAGGIWSQSLRPSSLSLSTLMHRSCRRFERAPAAARVRDGRRARHRRRAAFLARAALRLARRVRGRVRAQPAGLHGRR